MRDNSIAYIYDEPVEYNGLMIHPAKMRDFFEFNHAVQCLTIDKDSVPDSNIISMSYYEFLIYLNSIETSAEKNPMYKLDLLFRICFGLDRNPSIPVVKYGAVGKKPAFQINETVLYSKDFDAIKNIILKQNNIETFNPNINKNTRDMLEKARETKARLSGEKQCGLEDQMICLSISTGIPLETIYEMSIRKFRKYLQRIDHKLHYEIYKTATSSGFVEFKDKKFPKHWMIDLESDNNYEDVLVSFDSISNKINNNPK